MNWRRAWRETMHEPATFPAPQTFDPDRFSPERAGDKQPDMFIPHGGGPWDGHRCADQKLADHRPPRECLLCQGPDVRSMSNWTSTSSRSLSAPKNAE